MILISDTKCSNGFFFSLCRWSSHNSSWYCQSTSLNLKGCCRRKTTLCWAYGYRKDYCSWRRKFSPFWGINCRIIKASNKCRFAYRLIRTNKRCYNRALACRLISFTIIKDFNRPYHRRHCNFCCKSNRSCESKNVSLRSK